MVHILILTMLILPFEANAQEAEMWENSGFSRPTIEEFEPLPAANEAEFTHSFDLTVMNLRGSSWTMEQIRPSLIRTAEIYRPCGIKLSKVKILEVDPPHGKIDLSNWDDYKLSNMVPDSVERPLVFLFKYSLEGATAYAWHKNACSRAKRCNTIWITSDVNDPRYLAARDPSYSVWAHELAHILGNQDHIPGKEPNILSGHLGLGNDVITEQQCTHFKTSDLLKKIDAKR